MSLTFLLDEDINAGVADGLRRRGIDAVSVHDVGRANVRIADEDQLAYATAQGRVLVTYNRADFQALDARWRSAQQTHSGILWCLEKSIPRRDIGQLVRALETTARQFETLEELCLPLQRPSEPEE